jgi:hypothetical protein
MRIILVQFIMATCPDEARTAYVSASVSWNNDVICEIHVECGFL